MIQLTTQQLEVVQDQWEPNTTVNVVACPKCGKTVSLVNKVLSHLQNDELQPNEILILSLTNKSVENIIDQFKINTKLEIVKQLHISTIHGLATEIVSNNHKQFINIIEEHEWQTLRELLPINNDTVTRSKKNNVTKTHNLETMVRLWKNGLNTLFGVRHLNPLDEDMVQQTIKVMKDCNIMTNDDLISTAVNKLEHNQSTQFSQYKLILIDDAQDLYPNLLPFIEQLVQMNNPQLCLFHDPNERIYQFMGNNEQVINELLQINETTRNYSLTQNFGNTPEIINSATKVLSRNFERVSLDMTTTKPVCGVDPQVYEVSDSVKQLDFIVTEICRLLTTGVVSFNDIAILSRTNAFMTQITNHLNAYGVPCEKLVARPEWLNDIRIQFILNIFKIIAISNTKDVKMCNFAILVILSRLKGIGQKSLFSLYQFCSNENIPIWEYFLNTPVNKWDSSISNKSKIFKNFCIINDNNPKSVDEMKVDEIIQVVNNIVMGLDCPLFKYETKESLEDFKTNFKLMIENLQHCEVNKPVGESLLSYFLKIYSLHNPWKESTNSNTVKLSTIHSAKSLEFPIVMLANAPPANVQSDFPIDTNTLYSGMTRAQNLLYMININHLMVQANSFKKESNIALNEPFWKYYINSRNTTSKSIKNSARTFKYSLEQVKQNQAAFQRKFGIRFLSTLSCKYKTVYKRLY